MLAEAAEAELEAWQALRLSLTFSRLLVLKIEKLLNLFMHSNFRQASYSIYGVTVINYYDAVFQKIGVSNEDAFKIRKALQKRLGDN